MKNRNIAVDILAGDFGKTKFSLSINSSDGVHIETIDIDDVEELIEKLSHARSLALPARAFEPPSEFRNIGNINPIWQIEQSRISGYTSFALRHPGKGWYCTLLDLSQVGRIESRCKLALMQRGVIN